MIRTRVTKLCRPTHLSTIRSRQHRYRKNKWPIAIVFCFLLASCAGHELHTLVEESRLNLPPLTYDALPLSVGLVIDQNFRTYTKTKLEGGDEFRLKTTLRPGRASALTFEYLTEEMFERVEIIKDMANASKFGDSLDLVVNAQIVDANSSEMVDPAWISVTYRADIYDSRMQPISSFVFTARGEDKHIIMFRQTRYEHILEQTMRNVPAQFAYAFEDDVAIQKWLKRKGITRATAEVAAGSGLVVVKQADTASLASCIESEVHAAVPELRVLSAETVQDELYPWFEPGTWLNDDTALLRFLTRPGLAEKMNQLGLRFIVYVTSQTTRDSPEESGGLMIPSIGFYGIIWFERRSQINVRALDLHTAQIAADEEAQKHGTAVIPAYVVPVPFIPPTGTLACLEVGKRLAKALAVALARP